jgi:hypothetical protein
VRQRQPDVPRVGSDAGPRILLGGVAVAGGPPLGAAVILGHAGWRAGGDGRGAVVLAEQMFAGPVRLDARSRVAIGW